MSIYNCNWFKCTQNAPGSLGVAEKWSARYSHHNIRRLHCTLFSVMAFNIQISLLPFSILDATFAFTQTDYIVYEHELMIEICVELVRSSDPLGLRQEIQLTFRTGDITAGSSATKLICHPEFESPAMYSPTRAKNFASGTRGVHEFHGNVMGRASF